MDQLSDHKPRRAINDGVLLRQREIGVAAPLASRLAGWHQRAAKIGGFVNHALVHDAPRAHLRPQLDAFLDEVLGGLADWRSQVPPEMAGRVQDTERSCRSLITMLDQLRARLR